MDPRSVDYAQARAGLFARGHGRMVPDLDRITRLVELLADPQLAYPTVHVTGTNGKSSTTRMVAALLSELGLTAGTFTSPHLQTVRERFQVGLQPVSEGDFARAWAAVETVAELVDEEAGEAGDTVTFFELTTAMALWLFADLPVDIGVIEVGMGGRWDATNVVASDIAVITPIDVDHRELGDDAVAAAREKAGIIKSGSHVVLGAQSDEVLAVLLDAAAAVDAPVLQWRRDVEVVDRAIAVGGQVVALRVGVRTIADVFVPVHGVHQVDNAALALAAVASLLGPRFDEVDDEVVRAGFARVTTPGRLEVVAHEPTIVLDGAHNPHGARAAALAIDEAFAFRNVVLVIAALADKDLHGIVGAWRDVVDHVVVTRPDSPRAAPVERLAAVAEEVFAGTAAAVERADDVAHALELATGLTGDGDGVVVTGSLYTVGAARDLYASPAPASPPALAPPSSPSASGAQPPPHVPWDPEPDSAPPWPE